jgi:hypothetical protein
MFFDEGLPNPERVNVGLKPGEWNGEPCRMMPWQEELLEDHCVTGRDDEYDPEEDVEESSAELSDEAIADCFDKEGYEMD